MVWPWIFSEDTDSSASGESRKNSSVQAPVERSGNRGDGSQQSARRSVVCAKLFPDSGFTDLDVHQFHSRNSQTGRSVSEPVVE